MLPINISAQAIEVLNNSPSEINSAQFLINQWKKWAGNAVPGMGEQRDTALNKLIDCIDRQSTLLDLSNLELTEIPDNIPECVEHLNISNNKLSYFPKNLLLKLHKIDFENNKLEKSADDFSSKDPKMTFQYTNDCLPFQNLSKLESHNIQSGRVKRILNSCKNYPVQFSINNLEELENKLNKFKFEQENKGIRLAIVSGAGIVGHAAAITLKLKNNCNVVMLEKRDFFSRQNVLDLKKFTIDSWPDDLVNYLIKNNLMTLSKKKSANKLIHSSTLTSKFECKNIITPKNRPESINHQYISSDRVTNEEFNEMYALAQIRDLQKGMNQYCLDKGIDVFWGEITKFTTQDNEIYSPSFSSNFNCHDRNRTIELKIDRKRPVIIILSEGNNIERITQFGGTKSVKTDEVWLQRNYANNWEPNQLSYIGAINDVNIESNEKKITVLQQWEGPEGPQANISVLTPKCKYNEDNLFLAAQKMLNEAKSDIIISKEHETYRSNEIRISLTKLNNPIHGNVILLGDICGIGSPAKGRGANDGNSQINIMLDYINSPDFLSLDETKNAELKRIQKEKYDAIYESRHGKPTDLLKNAQIYTFATIKKIEETFNL